MVSVSNYDDLRVQWRTPCPGLTYVCMCFLCGRCRWTRSATNGDMHSEERHDGLQNFKDGKVRGAPINFTPFHLSNTGACGGRFTLLSGSRPPLLMRLLWSWH